LTAEQFADAIGTITGEWGVGRGGGGGGGAQPAAGGRGATGPRTDSEPNTSGVYAREFRTNSSRLSRALGRPIRDQVTSVRATDATTLQALELVNGDILTRWLMRGARRMIGELPPDPPSLFTAAVGGRNLQPRRFDADISRASKLWLIVSDAGSNAPERVLPVWTEAELIGPTGAVPLSSLIPLDGSDLRRGDAAALTRVPVKNGSTLVYDITGRGFTRLRGSLDVDNPRADIGSTLNPQLRFFIFDVEPNMARLVPPAPELPLPGRPPVTSVRAIVDYVFWSALGRAPSSPERIAAETAIADPARPGRASADAVADLLWAVLMKPEFQLIY
jgi:hypothetical protein